jgi:ArsR family transcriptional regulator
MYMPVDVATGELECLRAIAEPMRWRIVQLLADEELCVCHLVEELQVAQPLVSHHLRVLRDAGIVATSRHRYWTYYRLQPDTLASLARTVTALAEAPASRSGRRRPCC